MVHLCAACEGGSVAHSRRARTPQLEQLEAEYEGLQAEQLIEMVKDELHLIPHYASASFG